MGKRELENIRKLLKIRMRDCRGIHTLFILLLIGFLINAADIIQAVLKYQSEVKFINVSVYSSWAFGFTLIACVYYSFQYSEFNMDHQIFPQTRITRFVSFELYCYLIHVVTQLFALGLYLLQYLLCLLLNQIRGNVHFAYHFDVPFIITGFLVNLLYGCILISLIILISNIVRKYHWYAVLAYLIVFFLLWFIGCQIAFQKVLFFYLKESSPALFILKAVCTWLILEFISHLINLKTSIMSERKFLYRHIIIASVILLSFLVSYITNINSEANSASDTLFMNDNASIDGDQPYISIDASKLSSKAFLNIDFDFKQQTDCSLLYGDTFTNTSDDKIYIYFKPDRNYQDWVDVNEFTNPTIKAALKDNTLHIEYDYDRNVKVISLYPYSTLSQFRCFWGKHYAKAFSGNMSGINHGTIEITTPKTKQLIVK